MILTTLLSVVATIIAFTTEPIHQTVQNSIEHPQNVPGLDPELFNTFSAQVRDRYRDLLITGQTVGEGSDELIRPIFVTLQGIIEHSLTVELDQSLTKVVGIIHTPLPATPLCTKGEISQNLVSPEMVNDPKRLLTVEARAQIIQEFLKKGGHLYAAYRQGGLEKRSEDQQSIFRANLAHKTLFDRPINEDQFAEDLIGASYLFENGEGDRFLFSIEMNQADQTRDSIISTIWLGNLKEELIHERYQKILERVCRKSHPAIEF